MHKCVGTLPFWTATDPRALEGMEVERIVPDHTDITEPEVKLGMSNVPGKRRRSAPQPYVWQRKPTLRLKLVRSQPSLQASVIESKSSAGDPRRLSHEWAIRKRSLPDQIKRQKRIICQPQVNTRSVTNNDDYTTRNRLLVMEEEGRL
jgi:hypothetical protein